MKKTVGIVAVSLLMMSLTSLADVSYSTLGSDPSKVEPRADGVLVSKESSEIVVNINQYEAEAACANHGGLLDIETLAGMFGTNPHKEDSAGKCSDAECFHWIGQNEYLCYTAKPQSGELGNYWFWSSSGYYGDFAFLFHGYGGKVYYGYRGYGLNYYAARCRR